MSKIQKIKGVADLFPPESNKFNFMERTAREVFSRYGFKNVRIPIMEKTELFARSIGEETDVVQKEMYTFPDRKGRSLTLRPEATAGLMRAYIENKLYAAESVSKLFTFGPMFRYERPQKGRMRQFHQLDVEVIGAKDAQTDAELLLMLYSFLRELGLKKLAFEINSLGCRECRPKHRQALKEFFESINKDELCEDCRRRVDSNPLRVLDCKQERCRELTKDAPKITDYLCEDCHNSFEEIKRILTEMNVEFVHNPRLVRGLDYYVGLTFEVTSSDIGAQTAVAGGGRYDGLIKQLGGPDLPAIGFALGMERLALLLQDLDNDGIDFYVAVLDEKGSTPALMLAQELRAAGLCGEAGYTKGSMKSRLRAANKAKASWCLMLGTDELEAGEVTVKNLESGEQERMKSSAVCEYLIANR
ncbi:histidine--tRNA ligase [Desulfobaculum bizertense]|uniref:Histidine--tRNA ligase n=1 Tax=Desulfobaculum bizertense DSM 18034 TaxID=1121442 RepID=A0A1T4WBQ6_9BACT|nr:histidine--tRNA ligase [Desulfobaculum bizertense]UIJ37473.1 histidine--tRNA ligase [Desulfobaculum bizertense]SKA74710.1 histidyl-tRNA synthetase [Desulfobaculum bizertense DSM 18034]